jgi:Leucine-rich repeat (LRR) protein
MNNKLYKQLYSAYTVDNLNRITAKIIESYRSQQYGRIENLVKNLNGLCEFPDSKMNKYFARLVFLYHPDKINHYKRQLDVYLKSGQDRILEELSHILITMDIIDKKAEFSSLDSKIMDGFEMEFGFDDEDIEDINSWNVYDLDGNIEVDEGESSDLSNDFFTCLKLKEFGHADTQIPESELQNLDDSIILSGMQMDDLSGVEYCTNLKSVDLSDNHLTDITKLGYLTTLVEIDLSHNNIDDLSALSGLINLETLDLAFNDITDIRALFDLDGLKFVNLIGNPVPQEQIAQLRTSDRIVII